MMSPELVESIFSLDVFVIPGEGFFSMSCADMSPGTERETRVSAVIQIMNFKI